MKIILFTLTIFAVIGAVLVKWTETNLEFWLSLIKGQPVDVPYIIALILSIISSLFGFTFNIITELIKLVL